MEIARRARSKNPMGRRIMKLIRFSIPDQMDAWEALESTTGVTIEGVYRFDNAVIVKYTILEELLDHQIEEISKLKEIAGRLAVDKVLPSLKNATQRELYLMEVYNVDSYTAGRDWEYMKMQEKGEEGNN